MYTIPCFVALICVHLSYSINVNDPRLLKKLYGDDADVEHHPDFGLDISQFLEKYGYPLETHEVTTEDGYILTLHRIPHGINEEDSEGRPPVLLMHPLLSSSMDMVNLGPHKSIGLLLADEGYDVWLGNIRGNRWSRRHVSLDPDADSKFWDFSFDEGGLYDLPAKIDYILKVTGQEKLSYVGHSQGTSAFFAMSTLKPEYNEKVNVMVALAPIAYMQNLTQPLVKLLAEYIDVLDPLLTTYNINELLPYTSVVPDLTKSLCCDGCAFQKVCADFIFFLVGSDPDQMDLSFIEVIGSNAPAGASVKMLKHFGQELNSGQFRRYDYGTIVNLIKYQKFEPPNYDLSLITIPVALYYGGQDSFAAAVNVEELIDQLPNVVEKHFIDYFNHLDFIWAKDADTILYKDVIALLNTYNSRDDGDL